MGVPREPGGGEVMVSISRRDGSVRSFTTSSAVGFLLAIAAVGGFAGNLLAWAGGRGESPGRRFEALERRDSLLGVADNNLASRLDETSAQLDAINELTERMAALRCLDPASKQIVLQAQLPCARIFRNLGMAP